MLKTNVSYGCKITNMVAKADIMLRGYKRKLFRLVLGTRHDHAKEGNYVCSP
jgi:hypothetical protein